MENRPNNVTIPDLIDLFMIGRYTAAELEIFCRGKWSHRHISKKITDHLKSRVKKHVEYQAVR